MEGLLVAVSALAMGAPEGAVLRAGPLSFEARQRADGVWVRLADGRGIEYARGVARYQLRFADGGTLVPRARIAAAGDDRVAIEAADGGIRILHEVRRRSDGEGLAGRITVRHMGDAPLRIEDYRFGLRRARGSRGDLRAVAVPFRHQADGRVRDWSIAEIEAGRARNADWRNDATVACPEPVDSARGRLRSEGWILTDGRAGLLVAKYNQEDIEYGILDWEAGSEPGLTIGGSSFALYREPESMQLIEAGDEIRLGATYYLPFEGGWPAGYERFRRLLADLGHGLPVDYDPPLNWNELFDVGWYHSDPVELARHYTREALLREAGKAASIGATLLYLDPGWEVCEGTTLWDEKRLGTVGSLAALLRERHGIGLGFRTIGRVYRDAFPRPWYVQRRPDAGPYARPILSAAPAPEPVPDRDGRGCRNLALLPEARPRASSTLPGYAIHKVAHLNDGWYGNPASWISNGEPSWAEIDLGAPYRIRCVRIGSEHTPHYRDRAATHVRILLAMERGENSSDPRWRAVAERRDMPIRATTSFAFPPQEARWVRISILGSTGGNARIDEIEIYEARPRPWGEAKARRREIGAAAARGRALPFWEVCTQCEAWRREKLRRIEAVASQGMRFVMFDEFDWRGPCFSPDHGHPVPSSPEGHVRAVYGLIRELKRRIPGLLVEAHDPVWPWGVRYLPIYFDQASDPAQRSGSYEENWGFEFMWNPIQDLLSGRALCLYDYNLACEIPLYDHITMEKDNDACLAFWWYASTVRHLGIGGKKGLGSKTENETRWRAYRAAVARYLRLRPWFVRGRFIGIDAFAHLHVLPGRPGGVLVAFNLTEKAIERTIVPDPRDLGIAGGVPRVTGAEAAPAGGRIKLTVSIAPRSPRVVEIGIAEDGAGRFGRRHANRGPCERLHRDGGGRLHESGRRRVE